MRLRGRLRGLELAKGQRGTEKQARKRVSKLHLGAWGAERLRSQSVGKLRCLGHQGTGEQKGLWELRDP